MINNSEEYKYGAFKEFSKEKPSKPGIYLTYDEDIGLASIDFCRWTGRKWNRVKLPFNGETYIKTHWRDIFNEESNNTLELIDHN
jgi:hypothetical protein